VAAIALALMIASGGAALNAQAQAAAADPLKFTTSQSVVLGWQVNADKTKDWEDFWAAVKDWCAKSESADIKAFGQSLTKIVKVDQNFDIQGKSTNLYLFMLDAPSTVLSYNPVPFLFTDPAGFKAGQEGSKMTRPEADALFEKFKGSFNSVGMIWKVNKIGG
jgi:hypothetical protein